MIRPAGPKDRAAVEALLFARLTQAMLPLGNLGAHGLQAGGYASDHPHASRFWRIGQHGLLGLSQGGMLMPVLAGDADLTNLPSALTGQRVEGAVGPVACVRRTLAALGLTGLPTRRDSDEPAFALDLSDLRLPGQPKGRLIHATADHHALLLDWRAAYHHEILGTPADQARDRAAPDVDAMIAQGRHRLLVVAGQPVALTGFNAVLPGIVQVGGVYVPPALRGRGHAREAVALHLAEARSEGITRSVLFAASPAAARAYTAIGFRPDGRFTLVLFAAPATLDA